MLHIDRQKCKDLIHQSKVLFRFKDDDPGTDLNEIKIRCHCSRCNISSDIKLRYL